jgi:hypothetical protein
MGRKQAVFIIVKASSGFVAALTGESSYASKKVGAERRERAHVAETICPANLQLLHVVFMACLNPTVSPSPV